MKTLSQATGTLCGRRNRRGRIPGMVGTQDTAGWRHVPALDGVRGVAVIAVLLFHGGVSWARGGFLGVDAFFVLSGLLITSLLLDEGERRGQVDLSRFWSRRA